MVSWYPSSTWSRPLQISFFFDLKPPHNIHETRLIDHLDDLRDLLLPGFGQPVNGSVLMDGSISIVYRGQELLGPEYWFEFVGLTPWFGLVCESRAETYHYGQHSSGIVATPQADSVFLDVQAARGMQGGKYELPLEQFVREWILMKMRVARIGKELGDTRSAHLCDASLEWPACQRLIDLVGKDRLEHTSTAPLWELLLDPIPF